MSHIALGKLEQVDPKLLWTSEPAHFTPWLASNLPTLGEALGLELELVKVESSVGPFACDIEARDINTGWKVIIENQLQPTDHTHLGQLLTYAAGLDATVIVWVSPLVREQHRQAIDFLNRHTAEGLDFFAVGLEVVKIGDSLPAVVFRLAASPNAWPKTVAATNQSAVTSSKMLAYQKFFQGVIDELRTVHHFTNAKVGQPQGWYSFASGTKGFVYSASDYSGLRPGIHDISRTDATVHGLPRFNMPLELGMLLGAQRFGSGLQKQKSCLVLDRENYW